MYRDGEYRLDGAQSILQMTLGDGVITGRLLRYTRSDEKDRMTLRDSAFLFMLLKTKGFNRTTRITQILRASE